MPSKQILVKATPRDITVEPTRLGFPTAPGSVDLTWKPVGTGVQIENIEFDDPKAPISNLEPDGDNWVGVWNTREEAPPWKYSVTVTVNGKQKPVLDPEIENGPPDSGDEEEDEED